MKEIDCNEENVSLVENSVTLYIKSLNKKVLTREEEKEFLMRINNAVGKEKEKLKQEFIEHNLRLVISIAASYASKSGNNELLPDLIQQGNIGLLRALEKFDISKGCKFSSYAYDWIKKEIINYFYIDKTIEIPKHIRSKIKLYLDTKSKLSTSLDREVTDSDIAKVLNWSDEDTNFIGCLIESNINSNITSLNDVVNAENDNKVGDLIPDEDSLEDKYIENSMVSDVQELLNSDILTPKERQILLYRYNFYSDKNISRRKIAEILNMSSSGRELVRVAEIKALKKLKTVAKKKSYDNYLK